MRDKKRKIKVGIIFGGKSAEHEVSLQSAKNIIEALDKEKYEITTIGIDKIGNWYRGNSNFILNASDPKLIKLNKEDSVSVVPSVNNSGQLISLGSKRSSSMDVVFPVLHGPFGEDGTVQGLLKLTGIPFVGASVLGSAIGMDKDVMKRLFQHAKLPTAKFLVFEYSDEVNFKKIKRELGTPFFVKPANLGSSVGVSKVKNEKDFQEALQEAFRYDSKILVEKYIRGKEVECSVLGNKNPIASIPGEVLSKH